MEMTKKIRYWSNEINILLLHLPEPESSRWTAAQKSRWIDALEKLLDIVIEVVPEPEPDA